MEAPDSSEVTVPAQKGTSQASHYAAPVTPGVRSRATSDEREASKILAEFHLPDQLHRTTDDRPLRLRLRSMQVGGLAISRLELGCSVVQSAETTHHFQVMTPLSGHVVCRSGTSRPVAVSRGRALVFSPGDYAELTWSRDCVLLCLAVTRTRLEAELEHALGGRVRRPLQFDFGASLPEPFARQWRDLVRLADREVEHPTTLTAHPSAARHLEGLVLDTLLLTHPHNYTDSARLSTRPSPAIQRAVDLLEGRPEEPWTVGALAQEVHLSPRALQGGFERDIGVPPMTYLREVRLRRVHEILSASDPSSTSVRAVAAGLGFQHSGRFAATYREAFGVPPSETLSQVAGSLRSAPTRSS